MSTESAPNTPMQATIEALDAANTGPSTSTKAQMDVALNSSPYGTIAVKAGLKLPPSPALVPRLDAQQALPNGLQLSSSAIAQGISFEGNAVVASPILVAGQFTGNIAQAQGSKVHITIAETGQLIGDVRAHEISVLGKTSGLLDGGDGTVTLHETANVQGHVRYAKLQVSGAELNATLEKAVVVAS